MTNEIKDQLLEVAMKAVYAGHKYHLAIDASVEDFEQGQLNTPENNRRVFQYYQQWKQYSREAVALNEMVEQ